jgi:hypothetical protein
VGEQIVRMGVYVLDEEHSPQRGNTVYSLEGSSGGVHLYNTTDGTWQVGDEEEMLAGEPGEGWIASTTASSSPLGLAWTCWDGSTHALDPLLKVTACT